MRTRSGFTLIELMIVVAVIAIVAAIAIPNLLRSRIAAHEAAAVASCKAFASAEDVYRRTDWDADGVLEYASDIGGDLSLYETAAGAGDLQLVDEAFKNAESVPGAGQPKAGYVFLIRGRKGPGAPGGAGPYFTPAPGGGIDMTLGYALSAIPANYDSSGVNTYQISNMGVVFQRDRGPSDTGHLPNFDPKFGGVWVVAE